MFDAPLPRERTRGWYVAFVLFLACLVPLSPLLAQVGDNTSMTLPTERNRLPVADLNGGRLPAALIFRDLLLGLDQPPSLLPGFPMPADDNACKEGRSDGDREASGVAYFFFGLCLLIWGPLIAYIVDPAVPVANTRGMSAKAATSYTDCYKSAAKWVHVKWAWYGVGAVALLCGLIYLAIGLSGGTMSN